MVVFRSGALVLCCCAGCFHVLAATPGTFLGSWFKKTFTRRGHFCGTKSTATQHAKKDITAAASTAGPSSSNCIHQLRQAIRGVKRFFDPPLHPVTETNHTLFIFLFYPYSYNVINYNLKRQRCGGIGVPDPSIAL